MTKASLLILCLGLAGCSVTKVMESKGFRQEQLLQWEKDDWGQSRGQMSWEARAQDMGIPVDAHPIAIRDLKCSLWETDLFRCSFTIDYGRGDQIEGSYRAGEETLGRDEQGKWSLGWIVVT